MFSKVLVLIATVAVAAAAPQHLEAARYPAGVNPQSCPNYPNCDNAALHGTSPQHNQYNQYNPQPQYNQYNPPQPQYNQYNPQPQYNQYNPQPQYNQYNPPQYQEPANNHLGSGGDKYPAGVNPQSCPNYPFCDNSLAAGHGPQVAPLPGFTERLYPAGVSARECPNFPYCN